MDEGEELMEDEEFPLAKFTKAVSLLNEVKAQLSVIEDRITLIAISEMTLDSSRVFFEMHLLAQRKLERIEELTQYEKS